MNRFLLGCGIALAIIGCKGKETKSDPPPEPKAPPADKLPADKPPAAPTGFAKTDLGRVGTSTSAEDDPHLSLDAKGRAIVGYKSANKHYVMRWDAGAWKPVGGGPIACKSEFDRYAIDADADGSVIVAGTIMNAKGSQFALACVARETAEGWKIVGEPFGNEELVTNGVALVTGAQGPIVILHQRTGEEGGLEIRKLDGAAWKPLGDGKVPVPEAVVVPAFRAVGMSDGLVVAWLEYALGKTKLAVQRLAYADGKWTALPEVKDVDRDTSFELAAAADGSVLLARTWNPGFKEVLKWVPGAPAWASLENPGKREYTAHDPPAIAAGPKGEAILAWAGQLVEAAVHDGKAWTDIVKDLGRKPTIQMATRVAVASDGAVMLVWRDADSTTSDPARIYAASFAPANK